MKHAPVIEVLPIRIRGAIESLPSDVRDSLEEIRIRQNRPVEVITKERSWFVCENGTLSSSVEKSMVPDREDCKKMLNLITNHSLYTMEEELRRGYVTIKGGHRIGLVGSVVVEGGRVKHLRDVTGFNLRVAREVKGVGEKFIPYVVDSEGIKNTLIASPPQCGKTTILRDLVRLVSQGGRYPSYKVAVVDERSEIAGSIHGVPQHDLGPRTDVLDGCPKAEGMMMMIRSMSPDVLVVDEIGRKEDSEAIHEAIHAGVSLLTTIHAKSLDEICKRPTMRELINQSVFSRIMILSRKNGPGTLEQIFDAHQNPMLFGKNKVVHVSC